MIYAAFDDQSREATASDVYQYDTGQVLELSGLPPDLGGVTVEVHYGYDRDAKAEARIAAYDKRAGVWRADVPDTYLRRARTVNAYVYVIETELKKRTLYQVTWTPIERPAPSTEVTEPQRDAWAQLIMEMNGAIANADGAASRANAAAASVAEEIRELGADKASWETRLQGVESKATDAVSKAADAAGKAASAESAAGNAVNTANAASQAAAGARDRADSAHSLASSANAKATAALYQRLGAAALTVNTSGWTYDGTRDRYSKNHAVSGCTADMIPFAACADAGQNFPLCGVASYNGGVTLYMADTPTVNGTVVVRFVGVR